MSAIAAVGQAVGESKIHLFSVQTRRMTLSFFEMYKTEMLDVEVAILEA